MGTNICGCNDSPEQGGETNVILIKINDFFFVIIVWPKSANK